MPGGVLPFPPAASIPIAPRTPRAAFTLGLLLGGSGWSPVPCLASGETGMEKAGTCPREPVSIPSRLSPHRRTRPRSAPCGCPRPHGPDPVNICTQLCHAGQAARLYLHGAVRFPGAAITAHTHSHPARLARAWGRTHAGASAHRSCPSSSDSAEH